MNFSPFIKWAVVFFSITLANLPAFAEVKTAPCLQKKLAALEASFQGNIGVYALNTANDQVVAYRATARFPVQSTFKLMAIAALLKQSELDKNLLAEKVFYKKADLVFWSPLTEKQIDTGMRFFDLCAAAMQYSDNTATNLIVKKLGGPNAVTKFARSLGDKMFRIDNLEPNLNSNRHDLRDTSTPQAMGESLQKLTLGQVLSTESRAQLVAWMQGNTTGDTRIRAGVPKGWIVADKTGAGSYGIANDIAVLWPPKCAPIVLAIYTARKQKDAARRDDIVVAVTRDVLTQFAQADRCLKMKL